MFVFAPIFQVEIKEEFEHKFVEIRVREQDNPSTLQV